MPVMDGFAATEKIKVELGGEETIIIALTASAFEEDRAMMLAAGCDDFVRKPFQREELLGKISEHLHLQFVYEQPGTPGEELRVNVPQKASLAEVRECLAQMPPDWVQQVYELASQCIDDKILELLAVVPGECQGVVTRLSELVNEFQFTEIMELLENAKTTD